MQLRNSVRRHCKVHLGRAPGVLVAHEAAVQWIADVVGLGHVYHEVGGRAEPVAAGEEQLSAWSQVVGARNVPRVRRQGQGVAVHAHSRGVRGQDRCWGRAQDLLFYAATTSAPPSAEAASELVDQQTVHLHDGVVAEQCGCDARLRLSGTPPAPR